jgi:hypothetical protein
MGHRMSMLDLTLSCGLAGELSAMYGSGQAALQSRALHALVAGDVEEYESLCLQLSPAQKLLVDEYHVPTPFSADGEQCTLDSAEKEVEVTIDFGDGLTSVGHADLRWKVTKKDGTVLVVIIDMKLTQYTSNVDSLQLHGYGYASAEELDADEYVVGIWVIDEGYYLWGERITMMTERADEVWRRLRKAAGHISNRGTLGEHCHGCYARLHCGEYLMPPEVAETSLRPWTGAVGEYDADTAREALLSAQRAKDTAEAVIKNVRAFADRNGGIPSEDGSKVWSPSWCSGRKTVKLKTLKEEHPDLYERYETQGQPYQRYIWRNPPKKKKLRRAS